MIQLVVHLLQKLLKAVKNGNLISACKAPEQYDMIKPQNIVLRRLLQKVAKHKARQFSFNFISMWLEDDFN